MTWALLGLSTSNCSHFPPIDSTSATSSGVLDGVREVAMTV